MIRSRFAAYAWGVLAFTLAVVLWGAFVRATGSGAGCGAHWPLCNGQVVPRSGQLATAIEFTHRATSGVALLLVVGLVVTALRTAPPGHRVRGAALAAGFFMLLEAAIGAGLVLLELVAENQSVARALWMAAHLVNTFLLIGALTATAWWASGGPPVHVRRGGPAALLLGVALAGMLLLGASGAVTALGDTLFPASSLAEGVRQDLSPTAHVLVRLRVLHPVLALLIGAYVVVAAALTAALRPGPATRALARTVVALFTLQLGVGFLNLALLAPVWLQLVHLLLADGVWIALVLLTLAALAEPGTAVADPRQPSPARAETAGIH